MRIIKHRELKADGPAMQVWLYDEFDLAKKGPPAVFRHSILLTGGCELQVLFQSFKCVPLGAVFSPAPIPATAMPMEDLKRLAACTPLYPE